MKTRFFFFALMVAMFTAGMAQESKKAGVAKAPKTVAAPGSPSSIAKTGGELRTKKKGDSTSGGGVESKKVNRKGPDGNFKVDIQEPKAAKSSGTDGGTKKSLSTTTGIPAMDAANKDAAVVARRKAGKANVKTPAKPGVVESVGTKY